MVFVGPQIMPIALRTRTIRSY